MPRSPFRERLQRELEDRRNRNVRYSLRAFASFLGTDHSSLSQILRKTRRISVGQIRRWGKKLGMQAEEISLYIAAEHVPGPPMRGRQEQMRQWTVEGLAIVTDRTHWEILRLSREGESRPDSRWIAAEIGSTVDDVNVALSRLLRLRLLEIGPGGKLERYQRPAGGPRRQSFAKWR